MRQRIWRTGLPASLMAVLATMSAAIERPVDAATPVPPSHGLRQDASDAAIRFEPNVGQTDARVAFLARGRGYAIYLTDDDVVLSLDRPTGRPAPDGAGTKREPAPMPAEAVAPSVLRMRLAGAGGAAARVVGLDELASKSTYLIGNDPSKWHTDVPTFARVRYEGVYDGVDVDLYGNERQLEYDFRVAPGADPSQIRVRFDGAESVDVDASGALVLRMRDGEIRQERAVVYQEGARGKRSVDARYTLLGDGEVGFALGGFDPSQTLVIDPVLVYSTFLGGSDVDIAWGIAHDATGSIYVGGYTRSLNFPVDGPVQPGNSGMNDVFVTKAKNDGGGIVYSTYIGGSSDDVAYDLAVDGSGAAYVTGRTWSPNFPAVNAVQPVKDDGADAFVAKLSTAGNALEYSTYLGGSGDDSAARIAVDGDAFAYVTGSTGSPDFPTRSAAQSSIGGGFDAYVTKLGQSGERIVYSTFLGGWSTDYARGIAVDGTGCAIVTGDTQSSDFPTRFAFQPTMLGVLDAFVTKLTADGTSIRHSTFLGGSGAEYGGGIALGPNGAIYLTGTTYSTDFPTSDPIQPTLAGQSDVYVLKMNDRASVIEYSTYLGGSGNESTNEIAVDADGAAYVIGNTYSPDYPTANAVQAVPGGGAGDAFVTALNVLGNGLAYSTYLGGTDTDIAYGIDVDAGGEAYVTGFTRSPNFPVIGGFQTQFAGNADAFITELPALRNRFQFGASSFSVGEGGTATITVTRTGTLAGDVTVDYWTSDNTASERSDFISTSGTLDFRAGLSAQTFEVTTYDGSLYEGHRSLNLSLGTPSAGATLGAARRAPLTILDDEPVGPFTGKTADTGAEPVIQFTAPTYTMTAVPNAGSVTVTVTRTGNVFAPASVQYATSDNTATAGSDYVAASGFLSFPAKVRSRTFTITRLAGTPGQGNESLNLSLVTNNTDVLLGHSWRSVVVIEQKD